MGASEVMVLLMDAMTCRSTARCMTCPHWEGAAGCALENQIELALTGRQRPVETPFFSGLGLASA